MTKVLFISPHFDDVVLSCSFSLMRHLAQGDEVKVVTVFGGYEKKELSNFGYYLHHRWDLPFNPEDAIKVRKGEDIAALKYLGVDIENVVHLNFPDELYREYPICVKSILDEIDFSWPHIIYAPLGIRHQDHLILSNLKRWDRFDGYLVEYLELPYFVKERLNHLAKIIIPTPKEFYRKYKAIRIYKTQCRDLFKSRAEMFSLLLNFERAYWPIV